MSINPNSPFKIGMVYKTKGGQDIVIIGENNAEGSFHYHTVVGHDHKNRYTREGETECGRCTGGPVDNPDNLVPGTGRELHELGQQFAWDNWLKPLFDAVYHISELAGTSVIMSAHIPSADNPNRCMGYSGLFEEAPETMKKYTELMQSRPQIDSLLTPSSSCDTDSVNS